MLRQTLLLHLFLLYTLVKHRHDCCAPATTWTLRLSYRSTMRSITCRNASVFSSSVVMS